MKCRNRTWLTLFLLCVVITCHGQWVRQAKSRAFSRSNGVATDNSGNVYTAGVFVCIMAFDADSLLNNSCGEITPPAPPTAQTDGFLAKHDEDGNLVWAIQFTGSPGNKLFINDVAVDPSGNAYVTGAYTGTLDLISGTLNNPDPTTEFFVVKVQSDGTPTWVQSNTVGDLSETSAQKIDVTADAVYITGMTRGKFQIGATVDSVGRNASFVASFDLDGLHRWTDHFMEINANGSSRGKALTAQGDSIFVFSSFTDTVNVNGSPVIPPGPDGSATAGIICLYDAAGVMLNQIMTNTPLIEGMRLYWPEERLYITGRAENITAIGKDTLFNNAGVRAYISSHTLDADARLQWVTPLTAGNTSGLTGVDIDATPAGGIFATGTYSAASINGPSTTATGDGSMNGFIARLDVSGNDVWIQSFGGAGEDAVAALHARTDGAIFAAGYFAQYLRVAGDELHSAATSNGFVARIDICPELIADMLSPDSTYICLRDTTLFEVTGDPGYTYQWYRDGSPIALAESATLEVAEEGVYRAEITGSGCTKFTPVARLFLNPLPDSVVLTNDPLETCAGGVVNLAGPVGSYTFEWLDNGVPIGNTDKDIAITMDGDYQLEITDALNCSIRSDTFAIRFHPYPSSLLNPPPGRYTLCSGNSLLLEADHTQSGMTFTWMKDGIAMADEDGFQLEVTASGIYNALVRNAVGCETVTEADTVVVQQSPLVDLNDEDLPPEICDGNTVRLVTPSVVLQTYQWFRDGVMIPGASDNTLDVAHSGTYSVRVNNALCEKFSDSFSLTVRPLPDAVIVNSTPASICEGDPYALQAQEDATYMYQWLNNGTPITGETAPSFNATSTGQYALRVTNEFDCQNTSSSTTIVVHGKPPAHIIAEGETTFCEGGEVALSANAGTSLSYEWLKDGQHYKGLVQRTITVDEGGSVQVRVTNSNACSALSDPVLVQVVSYPISHIVSGGGSQSICERDTLVLTAGDIDPAYTYTWMRNEMPIDGAAGSTFLATTAGSYRLITAQGACRDTSATVVLQMRSNPVPVITRNKTFLSIAVFGDIQWYRDDTPILNAKLQSIRVTEDGEYSVRVTNAEGCSAASETVPMCLPLPEIQRTEDVLEVTIEGMEYAWKYGELPVGGASQRRLTAQQSGEYSVVVVSADGCTMETEPVVVCIPYPSITRDDFTGALYAFPNPAQSYQWYLNGEMIGNGDTQVHIPHQAGTYTVEVTDLEGCTSTSEAFAIAPVTGIEDEQPFRFYPNPVTKWLSVDQSGDAEVSLIISDAFGRSVIEQTLTGGTHQIDLSLLPAGVYTIVSRSSRGIASSKLIKH